MRTSPQLWFSFAETLAELSCLPRDQVERMLETGEIPSVMRSVHGELPARMVWREEIERVMRAVPVPAPTKDRNPYDMQRSYAGAWAVDDEE